MSSSTGPSSPSAPPDGAGPNGPRVLVVDDDHEICDLVRMYLENEGCQVELAHDGAAALAVMQADHSTGADAGDTATAQRLSLIILDIMLPDQSGFTVIRRARALTDAPILMLSAKDRDIDKAHALGLGADDYLAKPFSPIELVARAKASLRRYRSQGPAAGDQIAAGVIRVDPGGRRAWVRGVEVELTAKELDLLAVFAAHPGQVFTRGQLFGRVWGEAYLGDDNTVTVHVHRLRAKIELDPEQPKLIKTVWGIGYRLEVED